MRRCAAFFTAIMLVFLLWTAGTANAAERLEAIPATAVAGHYDGDKDEAPADSHKGVPHHHAPCGDHQIAAPMPAGPDAIGRAPSSPPAARVDTVAFGREPGAQLRPPIA